MLVKSLCHRIFICVICSAIGCGGATISPIKMKKVPVVPVKGMVTVDGSPEAGVIVRLEPVGAFDYPDLSPGLMNGKTNDDGVFVLGTYEAADGVPPGEYALTFIWPEPSLRVQSRLDQAKSDRLKGCYNDRATSPLTITVEKGAPVIIDDVIELVTTKERSVPSSKQN